MLDKVKHLAGFVIFRWKIAYFLTLMPIKKQDVNLVFSGASRGNRTLANGTTTRCSTIELYPPRFCLAK